MVTRPSAPKRKSGRPEMGLARRPAWLAALRDDALRLIADIDEASDPKDLRKAASAARQFQRAAEWFIRHKTFNGVRPACRDYHPPS